MRTFTDSTIAEAQARGVAYKEYRPPSINEHHIDGPLLYFSDGQLHWLTFWERVLFRLDLTDAMELQQKLRPRLTAELEGYWANAHLK